MKKITQQDNANAVLTNMCLKRFMPMGQYAEGVKDFSDESGTVIITLENDEKLKFSVKVIH